MLSFPFEIPPSLYSYLEKFEDNPDKITRKLENHLQRRGQDPIGQFLLAWFNLKRDKTDKALKHAIKAKAMAPGSPLLEFLPYFIRHPESFTAWQPSSQTLDKEITESVFARSHYPGNTDLDTLIEQISQVDIDQIRKNRSEGMVEEVNEEEEEEDLNIQSGKEVDDLISETLADIYEKQNQFKKAIGIYEKLAEYYPEHASDYEEAIKRLEKRIEQQRREE